MVLLLTLLPVYTFRRITASGCLCERAPGHHEKEGTRNVFSAAVYELIQTEDCRPVVIKADGIHIISCLASLASKHKASMMYLHRLGLELIQPTILSHGWACVVIETNCLELRSDFVWRRIECMWAPLKASDTQTKIARSACNKRSYHHTLHENKNHSATRRTTMQA